MKGLMARLFCLIQDESGASAVEYGLLIAGIAVAVMVAIYAIGANLNNKFASVNNQLGGGGPGRPPPVSPVQ